MTLQDSYNKIETKYGDKLTPFLICSRAVSIPETETNEFQIERLVKKKLIKELSEDPKQRSLQVKELVKDLLRRYKTPKQYKIANFKNYI